MHAKFIRILASRVRLAVLILDSCHVTITYKAATRMLTSFDEKNQKNKRKEHLLKHMQGHTSTAQSPIDKVGNLRPH